MGHTPKIIVYLKLKLNWASCILPGNARWVRQERPMGLNSNQNYISLKKEFIVLKMASDSLSHFVLMLTKGG